MVIVIDYLLEWMDGWMAVSMSNEHIMHALALDIISTTYAIPGAAAVSRHDVSIPPKISFLPPKIFCLPPNHCHVYGSHVPRVS